MNPGNNTFVYDTATLVAVVPNLKKSQKFFLDTFFPNIQDPDSEFIALDLDIGVRRMAPFVSPLVEGKLVEARRVQTNIFKPAYIKDKRAPDLRRPVRRMLGERIGGGGLTGQQREMANIQFEMEDQLDMLDRRLEWMAIQALVYGTVLVQGDGFPAVTVDFGRDAALSITLSGGSVWGTSGTLTSGISPVANLETWARTVLKKSGVVTTDVIFSTLAWDYFIQDPLFKATAILNPLWNPSGNVANPGTQITKGAVKKGQWGQFTLWLYNDWYVDPATNIEQPLLPDGAIVLTNSADLMGIRAFGQIMDPVHNYEALPYAPKTWIREDPAQRLMMLQSAPLPIPGRPNASMGVFVASS